MVMSVIFLSYCYPPLKYPRSIQIARLVKYSAHEITVACGDDDSEKDFSIDSQIEGKPAELFVFRKKKFSPLSFSRLLDWLYIPDQSRSWALSVAGELLETSTVDSCKVLVTFGQPMSDHLAGLEIKQAKGVPWIAHFSDPWVDSPYRRSIPICSWLNRRMERSVIVNADRVVFCSQQTAELVMSKYPSDWTGKTVIMPHSYDPSLYESLSSRQDGFVLRYLGNFYGKRNPKPLIQALLKLSQDRPKILKDIRVELIGKMDARFDLPNDLPPGLLSVCPSVNYRKSLSLMKSADLLLVIDAPFSQNVFLPSKLVDYIGATRPVFAITPPGVTADIVSRLGGYVAHPLKITEIAEKLALAIASLRHERPDFWISKGVQTEFEASSVASRMDVLINGLIQENG